MSKGLCPNEAIGVRVPYLCLSFSLGLTAGTFSVSLNGVDGELCYILFGPISEAGLAVGLFILIGILFARPTRHRW